MDIELLCTNQGVPARKPMEIELKDFGPEPEPEPEPEPKMVLMGDVKRQVLIREEYQTVGQLLDYLNRNKRFLTGGAREAIGSGWFRDNLIIQILIPCGHGTQLQKVPRSESIEFLRRERGIDALYVTTASWWM
tara:strand:- start:48 stop:449 length:402 start_codon:yes stop_codon:yes gene_type:complete